MMDGELVHLHHVYSLYFPIDLNSHSNIVYQATILLLHTSLCIVCPDRYYSYPWLHV